LIGRISGETTRAEFLTRAGGGALGLLLFGGLDVADALARGWPASATWHFRTRPDLRPARLDVLEGAGRSGDYLFMAPSSGAGQRGVLILDDEGRVVFFRPTTPLTAMNFRTALYKGEPVLTWWEGRADRGLGRGMHIVMDSTYRVIARLPAGAGRQSDLHEFALTPHGTAIVTSYEVVSANLTSVGGPSGGQVIGGIVQEIDIPSARVVREWRSLREVAMEESYAQYTGHSYDYFHVNSVDVDADGHWLVSARNTWAVYKVHRDTGKVLWRLGGKRSDFGMGPGTRFAWQHDARHHDEGRLITIFDNSAEPPVASRSRVLVIALDRRNRKARLVRSYAHPRGLLAPFMGNAQLLPNGNVLVGWGGLPYVTEFRRAGGIHFDARLPSGGMNYRAFRLPWVGRPHDAPKALGRDGRLFVSWNGATEVVAWRVDAGSTRAGLASALTRPRRGFETSLPVPRSARFAAAVALGPKGRELGRSSVVRV
jgi:hypothetical protein